MTPDEKRSFFRDNHRAVLITRRSDDGLQSSPIVCALDDDERHVVISVTQDRAKTKNLRRDPRATLCGFADEFFGPWAQVEGNATIVDLPEAMEGLKSLYRKVAGEHPDWDEYEAAMETDKRCLIRIPID